MNGGQGNGGQGNGGQGNGGQGNAASNGDPVSVGRPLANQSVRKAVTAVNIRHIGADGAVHDRPDVVVSEEPLQILAGGPGQDSSPVAVTMRTPGHDFELAVGFLWGEGLLAAASDVAAVRYCEVPRDQPQLYNVVTVRSRRTMTIAARTFPATASCGICGTASLDQVEKACAVLHSTTGGRWSAADLLALPTQLRIDQKVFASTGGLHAAGLFEAAPDHTDGQPLLLVAREDVGRHNAVDKVVGWSVLARRVPLRDHALVVSGRVSFEIVQKAAMAGIAVIVAVSAPSSLAVEAARRLGVTLVAFVRDGAGNVYTHADRVLANAAT